MLYKAIILKYSPRNLGVKLNSIYLTSLLFLALTGCQIFHPHKASFNNFNAKEMPGDVNVALALSGGGVRSAAQLGVIDILEKNGIAVDMIAGVSGGSIVGALYSEHLNAFEVKEMIKEQTEGKLLGLSDISVSSLISGFYKITGGASDKKLKDVIYKSMTTKYIQDLKLPFVAVATDVSSGSTIGLRSGDIFNAIRASSAIPGVFSPVVLGDMTLVDGGVTAPIPIEITKRFSPNLTIAVDTSAPAYGSTKTTMGIVVKSLKLSLRRLRRYQGRDADILIRPELENTGYFSSNITEDLFKKGQETAIKHLPQIKQALRQKSNRIKPTKPAA